VRGIPMFVKRFPPFTRVELQGKTPNIDPVPRDVHRPFWSVVIPTFNRPDELKAALDSLLCQDPGPTKMQIVVVDNCSSRGNAQLIVNKLAGERVTFYRHQKTISSTENQNFCLNMTSGQWVHILHDDDILMPGFYDAYKNIIESNVEMVMVQGRVVHTDELKSWRDIVGPLPDGEQCVLKDYHLTIGVQNTGVTSGTVVKRDVYEKVGGLALIEGSPEWDLWCRIAKVGPVGGTVRPYVLHRVNPPNYMSGEILEGKNIVAACRLHEMNIRQLGIEHKKAPKIDWRPKVADCAEGISWHLGSMGHTKGQLVQAKLAFGIKPNWRRFKHLVKSWLRHRIKAQPPATCNGHSTQKDCQCGNKL
jgi:hypothetical protein